jgi:hypothetical protein
MEDLVIGRREGERIAAARTFPIGAVGTMGNPRAELAERTLDDERHDVVLCRFEGSGF